MYTDKMGPTFVGLSAPSALPSVLGVVPFGLSIGPLRLLAVPRCRAGCAPFRLVSLAAAFQAFRARFGADVRRPPFGHRAGDKAVAVEQPLPQGQPRPAARFLTLSGVDEHAPVWSRLSRVYSARLRALAPEGRVSFRPNQPENCCARSADRDLAFQQP